MTRYRKGIGWAWLFALLAAATLAGNYDSLGRLAKNAGYLRSTWGGRCYRSAGDHVDLPRSMVERHVAKGSDIYFVYGKDGGLRPVGRSQHIAMSWAACPYPVRYGGASDIGDADAVLITKYGPDPDFATAGLDPGDFEKVEEGGGLALWMKKERQPQLEAPAAPPSPIRELAGLAAPAFATAAGAVVAGWTGALLSLLVFSVVMAFPPLAGYKPPQLFVVAASALCPAVVGLLRPWLRRSVADKSSLLWNRAGARCSHARPAKAAAERHSPHTATRCNDARRSSWGFALAAGLLSALLSGALALSHTFVAPNGLGVSGGRAKLMYLSGGIPPGFFTDAARRTLQPAYPPGHALITLGCCGLAGGCGEWLTQLLGVVAGALVIAWLGLCAVGAPKRLWVIAVLISPLALRMGSLYYSETFAALFILLGWERLREDGYDPVGWLLVGAAGWFKNEGLVYLLAIWLVLNFARLRKAVVWRNLALAAALPAAWHVWCRLQGASLDDFGAFWRLDIMQAWEAAVCMCGYALAEPWLYGFAFPVALVVLAFPACRQPNLKRAVAVSALCAVFFACIFAISESPYFDWQLKSLERLLWVPSLLLVREIAIHASLDPTVRRYGEGCRP